MSDILDRSLLSDKQRDLYRLVQKLLNQVYLYTMVKEKYLFTQAEQEAKRLDNIEAVYRLGQEVAEEDLECLVQEDTLTQLKNLHAEFYSHF